MTEARWQQIKALVEAAVERPPSERAAFVAAATGGDEALRREVESLLEWDSSEFGFTDRLPVRLTLPPANRLEIRRFQRRHRSRAEHHRRTVPRRRPAWRRGNG